MRCDHLSRKALRMSALSVKLVVRSKRQLHKTNLKSTELSSSTSITFRSMHHQLVKIHLSQMCLLVRQINQLEKLRKSANSQPNFLVLHHKILCMLTKAT